MTITTNSKTIAQMNDQFRSRLQIPVFGTPEVQGCFVMTSGIAALSPEDQICICAEVRNYADFTEDDDPYGEHDFGSIDYKNVGKLFWKIDYYSDSYCTSGSETPSDPNQSYRVLTTMLASEY